MSQVIATILPEITDEQQMELDAVDEGAIRADIYETLVQKGYRVDQPLDCFVLNENIEINLSDSLIKDLTVRNGYEVKNFVDNIIEQYDYLMNQPG